MNKTKTFEQLKPGDKIYYFHYKNESTADNSWEDETEPWNYIGSLGSHITGAPYLGNIRVANIYAPTEIREDGVMFVYVEFISDNGTRKRSGGIYLSPDGKHQTTCSIEGSPFVPEYNSKNCSKFERGRIVLSTNKDECHIGWSAVWNDIFQSIEHERCKLELWKSKLINWSGLEKEKYNKL